MFDLGWTELLVIGIVALIVVGPKDLPGMFRAVGTFVGKAKRMAREFSQAMNDAADDSGMSDVQKTLRAASNPMKSAMDEVRKSTESFTKKTMDSGKPALSPERAEVADKIRQKSADKARERQARERAEADAAAPDATKTTGSAGASPAKTRTAVKAVAKPGAAGKGASKTSATKTKTVAKTSSAKPAKKAPAQRASRTTAKTTAKSVKDKA